MWKFDRKQRISPLASSFANHKTGHVIENDVNVYQQEISLQRLPITRDLSPSKSLIKLGFGRCQIKAFEIILNPDKIPTQPSKN